MSKDIRSFFNIVGSKGKPSAQVPEKKPAVKKRKPIVLSSDEDEAPEKKDSSSSTQKKRPRAILSSDDEIEEVKSKDSKKQSIHQSRKSEKKEEPKKLVDVASIFGNEPIKRKVREKALPKKPCLLNSLFESDEELDKSLMQLDETQFILKKSTSKSSKEEIKKTPLNDKKSNTGETLISPEKTKKTPLKDKRSNDRTKSISPKKIEEVKEEQKSHEKKKDVPVKSTPVKETKSASKASSIKNDNLNKSTSERKRKNLNKSVADSDETQMTDEDRQQMKRARAQVWNQMQNRPKVLNHGCKEIPKGKPDCLKGLTFLVTGVLESMEREEANMVIVEHGGNVAKSVVKKLNYLVVGDECGQSKLSKAQDVGAKKISEDDLLNLIREKSGMKKLELKKASPKKEEKISPKKEKKVEPKKEVNVDSMKNNGSSSSSQKTLKTLPMISTIKAELSEYEKDIKSVANLQWVDKYKPTSLKQIIGQVGASSNAQKLLNWLGKWSSNNNGKKTHPKPNVWNSGSSDGAYFKCALLSGSPGVGKTTTAQLVCKELGFDAVEFNASDTRSKKLLKEEVSELLSNKSLYDYARGDADKVSKRHCLIMDEVDGMAGNQDRGGVAELIALIKSSQIPIICMCNDRNHPKMRSLVNYCYDLRFSKPRVEQIKAAMMSICFKEGLKFAQGALDEIIAGTGHDVRQTLNHLAMYSASKTSTPLATDVAKKDAKTAEKDVKLGMFDVTRKIFSSVEQKKMNFGEKAELFFHDYNMASLFVQENYLKVKPNVPGDQVMKRVAMAADAMTLGDLVEKKVRSNMAWALLPTQAVFSTVLPGEYMSGTVAEQVNFPSWLGKYSRGNKRKRLAQEIVDHTRTTTSGSRLAIRMDYAPFLLNAIVGPLQKDGLEGVPASLAVIKEYRLLREDIESLIELTSWGKASKSPWDKIDGKVKAALTRAYNKEIGPYSYSVVPGMKKKQAAATSEEHEQLDGEEAADSGSEHEEKDEDIGNAFLKKKKAVASTSSATTSKPKDTKKKPAVKKGK